METGEARLWAIVENGTRMASRWGNAVEATLHQRLLPLSHRHPIPSISTATKWRQYLAVGVSPRKWTVRIPSRAVAKAKELLEPIPCSYSFYLSMDISTSKSQRSLSPLRGLILKTTHSVGSRPRLNAFAAARLGHDILCYLCLERTGRHPASR
jgi:hypothetical protein